ncbi:Lipopolysaccharide core heptosyltransferase rfaQ [Fusobacterium necrogenes]|uniref:Lipopolysaccharide core heptosyltransferase rfaQ n=2 Tax=Fusobacterium necrogenes TaxID=858 RepID=A0A377GZ92_9FUSO|nr:Lipopolysaccharide core heptosyltransferase rfaQ [Fusobacterium necrogenes]
MKILVIRMSSIGDIILTTPVLKAFKRKYPELIIDFVVLEQFKDAISGLEYIDNLITFSKKKDDGIKNIKKFAARLRENNYDYVFDLHAKFRSKMIAKELGVRTYTYKKRAWWKTLLVKLRVIRYQVDDTIVKNYFGAFKDFDLEYVGEDLDFKFEENIKLRKFEGLPVMAPKASKNTKEWTSEGFAKLAKLIFERYGLKSVLIGAKQDISKCEEINRLSENSCIVLAGKLSLKESGGLLAKAKFLVTNDSGPFHIARGVGCRTFVIFGPTSPGMFEFGRRDTLIYANESCSPCSLHGDKKCPRGHFKCMKEIRAKEVLDIIDKKINEEE